MDYWPLHLDQTPSDNTDKTLDAVSLFPAKVQLDKRHGRCVFVCSRRQGHVGSSRDWGIGARGMSEAEPGVKEGNLRDKLRLYTVRKVYKSMKGIY